MLLYFNIISAMKKGRLLDLSYLPLRPCLSQQEKATSLYILSPYSSCFFPLTALGEQSSK